MLKRKFNQEIDPEMIDMLELDQNSKTAVKVQGCK